MINLSYKTQSRVGPYFLDDFRLDVEAQIYADDILVGQAKFSRLHVERLAVALANDTGAEVIGLFDASASMLMIYETLYETRDDACRFKPRVYGVFPEIDREEVQDLLYLEQIILIPQARGLGVGSHVVQMIVADFGGGCGLVIAMPEAIPRAGHPGKSAKKKLAAHWEQIGFRRIAKDWWGLAPLGEDVISNYENWLESEFELAVEVRPVALPDFGDGEVTPAMKPYALTPQDWAEIRQIEILWDAQPTLVGPSRIKFARGMWEGVDLKVALGSLFGDLTWVGSNGYIFDAYVKAGV
jgi:hypothetical protein